MPTFNPRKRARVHVPMLNVLDHQQNEVGEQTRWPTFNRGKRARVHVPYTERLNVLDHQQNEVEEQTRWVEERLLTLDTSGEPQSSSRQSNTHIEERPSTNFMKALEVEMKPLARVYKMEERVFENQIKIAQLTELAMTLENRFNAADDLARSDSTQVPIAEVNVPNSSLQHGIVGTQTRSKFIFSGEDKYLKMFLKAMAKEKKL